jgi:single-stranded-DNA-specific exonuclease
MGNPGVRLMVPSARVSDVRTMGQGKHARFSLHSGAHRALGVAFGRSSLGVGEEDEVDASVRLEVNHWNGAVEPRVVLRELYPLDAEPQLESEGDGSRHRCGCEEAEWWRRFEAELARSIGDGGHLSPQGLQKRPEAGERKTDEAGERTLVGATRSPTAAIAELVSSGAGVLAVCADASRRASLASGASGLARFNGGSGAVVCWRCGAAAVERLKAKGGAALALTDYATLESASDELAERFEHVMLIDPPPTPLAERRAASGAGFLHALWTGSETEFALAVLGEQLGSRQTVATSFRALREAGECGGERLRTALCGDRAHPLGPSAAARCFRVLVELGLVRGEPSGGDGNVGVVSSEGTKLERSSAFRAYAEELSEARRFLERPKPR